MYFYNFKTFSYTYMYLYMIHYILIHKEIIPKYKSFHRHILISISIRHTYVRVVVLFFFSGEEEGTVPAVEDPYDK